MFCGNHNLVLEAQTIVAGISLLEWKKACLLSSHLSWTPVYAFRYERLKWKGACLLSSHLSWTPFRTLSVMYVWRFCCHPICPGRQPALSVKVGRTCRGHAGGRSTEEACFVMFPGSFKTHPQPFVIVACQKSTP